LVINNLIINYGEAVVTTESTSNYEITLPMTYTTKYVVVKTNNTRNDTTIGLSARYMDVYRESKSKISTYVAKNIPVMWMAIGY